MFLFAVAAMATTAAACVPVTGPNILARDVARAVSAFTPENPEEVVGYAPSPGITRVMHAGELRQVLHSLGYQTDDVLADVCFARPVTVLSEEDVTAAMRRTLGPSARIELLEISQFPAPAGTLVFPLEQLGPPPISVWRGYVLYDGDKKFGVWARLKVTVPLLQATALEDLKPGVPIAARQVGFEKIDGFPGGRVTAQSLDAITGAVPRRFIAAKSPVWKDAIDPPNDVTKGDRVVVTVRSGLAQLSFDAEAQGAGRRGDRIALKNPESGRVFRAQVQGPGRAAVETGPVER